MKYWVKFRYEEFVINKYKGIIKSVFVDTDNLEKWWEEEYFRYDGGGSGIYQECTILDVVILPNELNKG